MQASSAGRLVNRLVPSSQSVGVSTLDDTAHTATQYVHTQAHSSLQAAATALQILTRMGGVQWGSRQSRCCCRHQPREARLEMKCSLGCACTPLAGTAPCAGPHASWQHQARLKAKQPNTTGKAAHRIALLTPPPLSSTAAVTTPVCATGADTPWHLPPGKDYAVCTVCMCTPRLALWARAQPAGCCKAHASQHPCPVQPRGYRQRQRLQPAAAVNGLLPAAAGRPRSSAPALLQGGA